MDKDCKKVIDAIVGALLILAIVQHSMKWAYHAQICKESPQQNKENKE
jgi:hypothetical protein